MCVRESPYITGWISDFTYSFNGKEQTYKKLEYFLSSSLFNDSFTHEIT
jgi:hypothetical protein